jgi:putative membrane protein
MKTRLTIATALALALAACGSQEQAAAPKGDDPSALPSPVAQVPDTSTPQGFVDAVAASDMYEVEAAKLAQEMGTSKKVKDFALTMIEDHTASSEKLGVAVAAAANELAVEAELTAKQRQDLDALKAAGDRFDQVYAQQQVAAHQDALALLKRQVETGTVEQLKTFAKETATVVQGHLEKARELP